MSKLPIELQNDDPELGNSTHVQNLKTVFNEESIQDTAGDSTFVKNLKIVYGGKGTGETAVVTDPVVVPEPVATADGFAGERLFQPSIDTATGAGTDGSSDDNRSGV